MAILFDEVDDYFSIANDASLTLPDDDWCVGIWTRVTDNSGSFYQYILSNNNYGVNNSFNLFLVEAAEGADPNEWAINTVDGDGTTVLFDSGASAPGADGLWRLIIIQRVTASSQIQMWFCTFGGTPAMVNSASDSGFNAVDGGIWNIGRRVDGNIDRYYGSIAAEFFKGDFSLSQSEIAALGSGWPIYALGKVPDIYLIMGESVATLVDLFGSNDATRNSAPTTVEHVPIVRPISTTPVIIGPTAPSPPISVAAAEFIVPSHTQSNQLTIAIYKPAIGSYTPAGTFLYNLSDTINAYSHTIQALGGYWEASFSLGDRLGKLEDWLDGLGWHIEVYNPALVKIWEGFVNEVTLGVGGFSVTRGPLMNIANRVTVWYSLLDTTITPPATGISRPTPIAEDTASQAKYGIVEKTLSVGSVETTDANQIRDTFLAENALPETGKSVNLGGSGSEASITVNCLGYVRWLDFYVYDDTASGTRTITQKIQDVMGADPNTLFSTDYANIATNNLLVSRYDTEERTAWAIIKALVARGDVNDNRYIFGIYNNQVAYYDAIPTDIEYYQRLADPSQRVETLFGQWVKPWDVQVGKWLLFPDFLIGKVQPTNIRLDQRAMFIESLTYTAPWALSLTGGKVSSLSQRLARLGLGGTGA